MKLSLTSLRIPGLTAISLLLASLVGSCKSREFAEKTTELKQVVPAPRVNPATQFDPDKMTGKELWEQTEANVFSPKVQEIEIRMNEPSYASLYKDERDNGCSADFDGKWAHIRSLRFNNVNFHNVAMRVRGNTSVCIPRLQFTLSFDKDKEVFKKNSESGPWEELNYSDPVKAIVKSQTLFGLDQISLRRSQNDTSAAGDYQTGALTREFVSNWAVSQAEKVNATTLRGASVYRIGYAKVIWKLCQNDADKTCSKTIVQAYNLAENIDKSFFKMRWDDAKPTLFQHNKGCGFKSPPSFSVRCYDPAYLDGKKFDDKDPAQVDKATQLIAGTDGLMTKLNALTTSKEYDDLVDVSSAVNLVMASSMVGHWDSAVGNFNNDFVYFNPTLKKWKFIIWDLDNTFGRHADSDLSLKILPKEKRALVDPLLTFPDLNDRFKTNFRDYMSLLHTDRNGGALNDKIIEARDCYVGELNNDRPGQGLSSLTAPQVLLDKLCSKTGIWSTQDQRKKDFFFLSDAEKMDKSKADPLFDFRQNRYLKIQSDLK